MINIPVPFAKLDNSIITPAYAHEGDAGIDLRSTIDCVIEPFERLVVPTGVAFAIPEGYAGLVIPRSGLAGPPRSGTGRLSRPPPNSPSQFSSHDARARGS